VNIFPRQIEELIVSEPGLSPHYRIDVTRDGAMDALTITCEAAGDASGARETLSLRMKSRYGLTAEIVIAEAGSLPRSGGKRWKINARHLQIEFALQSFEIEFCGNTWVPFPRIACAMLAGDDS
jgi:phenylacetate-coenzyme A ligase PaaK-like adenylate-forming protein